jgi:hypothetical protein
MRFPCTMGGMFIRDYVIVDRSLADVEMEFFTGARRWLPSMAVRANGRGTKLLSELGFDIGPRRIAKRIEVRLGELRRIEGVTLVRVHWHAAEQVGLFPSLDGHMELAALGPTRTQVGISASYEPPMGLIGKIADRALLHRVAEATVRDFMERIRLRLAPVEIRGASVARRVRPRKQSGTRVRPVLEET